MQTLAAVVNLVQMDLQDYTTAGKTRYGEYSLLGLHKLNFKANPMVSVHYFTPNSALTAPLPPDFEFYTKVAIIICGIPYTLTYNDKIPIPKMTCGVELPYILCNSNIGIDDLGNTGFSWVSHYRAGQYVGEYYSLGGGWNSLGYFRIDYKNNQIVMQGIPQAEFMMEYVSNGSDGEATLIENKALYPLRNYVHWQLKEHSNVSLGEKIRAEENYLKEYQDYKKIAQAITIDEFVDKMYAGFSSGLKGVAI